MLKPAAGFALILSLTSAPLLAADEAAKAPAEGGWGGLTVTPTGQVQFIVTAYDMNDPEQNDPIVLGDPDLDEGFSIRRARVGLEAEIHEGVEVAVELARDGRFTGGASGSSNPSLNTASLTFQRGDLPGLRMGVDRIDYGAEGSTSSKRLLMIERSVTAETLGVNRDVGLALFGVLGEKGDDVEGFTFRGLRYDVGAYNGSGTLFGDNNGLGDTDNGEAVGANPFGLNYVGRISADLGTKASPKGEDNMGRASGDVTVRVGAGGYSNRTLESRMLGYGADLAVFVGPFNFQAEYLSRLTVPQFTDEGLPDVLDDVPSRGFYLEAGVFAVPDRVQLAARFESYDGNTQLEDSDDLMMITGALNYYPLQTDTLKVQVNYVSRIERPADINIANDSLYLSFGGYF